MILEKLGQLSAAQALTGTADSSNVINIGTDEDMMDDAFLVIDTAVAAGSSGGLTIDLILSDRAGLDTNTVKVMTIIMADENDKRIATAGAHIFGGQLPREVRELAAAKSYDYLGLIYTISGSLTITVNACITTAKPRTKDNTQVTVSNVGVPTT